MGEERRGGCGRFVETEIGVGRLGGVEIGFIEEFKGRGRGKEGG